MELEKSNYEKFLDFINQPFMIAILVTLIVCIFVLIVLKSTQFGKKSIINQNKEIAKVVEGNSNFKIKITKEKLEMLKDYNEFYNKVNQFCLD